MRKGIAHLLGPLLILAFLFSCAGLQKQVVLGPNIHAIYIYASNYKFQPNNIRLMSGGTVTLKIRNTAHKLHNFTLTDPDGRILQSVNLPPDSTVSTTAAFPRAGTYKFYCDRPFHRFLGMRGEVRAVGK